MPYFNGPTYIDTPQRPVVPIGIFDAAMGPMEWPRPESQGGGIIYVPDACEDDVFLIAMDCPPITGTKTFSPIEAPVSGAPFTVMTSYTCGSIGFSFAEVEQRVRTRMDLHAQRAVEKRIWSGSTGTLGTIPSLFAGATNLGSAGCPVEAVQILEQTLADNAVIGGIIHARPAMSPHLANNHLVERGDNRRQRVTPIGTQYAFGQGYAGTGPSGGAISATSEWMFASGRVLIWAGDTFVPPVEQTLNKTNNQVFAIAEKTFAVAIECGVWAIQVNHTCTTAGST
jgi:hypothetical protein